jgi:shikimate kinase
MYFSTNTTPCTLLILVRLKGAGKSFIGKTLEKSLPIKFVLIESIFLELMQKSSDLQGADLEQAGFTQVLKILDDLALTHPILCIESTGTAPTLPQWLDALNQGFKVLLIQVKAPFETCIQRVLDRDSSIHLPVSVSRLKEINEQALRVNLPWDLELDNSEGLAEADFVQAVRQLLEKHALLR